MEVVLWSIEVVLQLWETEKRDTEGCSLVALNQTAALYQSLLAAANEARQEQPGRAAGDGLKGNAAKLLESQQLSSRQ